MAACCYFGADLGNGLDHNFPSRLTDGTPHSSSDLLYFTLLLPFTWTIYSKSNSLSPSYSWTKFFQVQFLFPLLFGQNNSKSKLPLLFALPGQKNSKCNSKSTTIFYGNFILCFSRKSLPILQKYSKSHLLPDLERFPLFCLPISYS